MPRKTVTDTLLGIINTMNGKEYPDVGYVYSANLNGGYVNKKNIWTIANDMGGVTYSDLNRATPNKTCDALRGRIIMLHETKEKV